MNLYKTDPEFMERMEYFTREEVVNDLGQEFWATPSGNRVPR